jgi:hypothetical protein
MAYKVGFGKHEEKTLEWLFFHDPGYVWWMIENNEQEKLNGAARMRFDELIRRAKHLAIPGTCSHCEKPVSRMCLIRHPNGGLTDVVFFCNSCYRDGAISKFMTPSFFTPDVFKNYDKTGAKILVAAIKDAYFDNKVRMTQAKMEEFFDDPTNFVNP